MIKKILKLFLSVIIFSIIIFIFSKLSMKETPENVKEIIICLDPGHGGKPEYGNRFGGDHWDNKNKKFLKYYNFGAEYKDIKEHEYTWNLSVLIKKYLDSLNSSEGLEQALIFLENKGITLKGIKKYTFKTVFSRKEGYNRRDSENNINRFYRIFDSPEDVKDLSKPLFKGRLSRINGLKPHFTLSLHLNYVESQKYSGVHSFFAPSYTVFNQIYKNRKNEVALSNNKLFNYWNIISKSKTMEEWMINDALTYLTGYKFDGRPIGKRFDMIDWKYKNSKDFWSREKSKYEHYRRNLGPEGIGGDNLYFSNEILRYLSYFYKGDNKELDILEPRASDWSVCIFNNSITAGLELGNVYSDKDRKRLKSDLEKTAKYIAYAILSIINDVNIKDIKEFENMPKAERIDLEKYEDYFSSDKGAIN